MTNSVTLISKNGLCSIQDLGRPKAQHLGFSAGGVSDEFSFLTANQLLANPPNAPALEVTLGQISLRSQGNYRFALTGADCQASINENPIRNWAIHTLRSGDVLTLKRPHKDLHTYLAFAGGIRAQQFMHSCAQSQNEQALGLFSPPLIAGSTLYLAGQYRENKDSEKTNNDSQAPGRSAKHDIGNRFIEEPHFHRSSQLTLRFMPSPLWQQLTPQNQQDFLEQSYQVLPQSNRVGYRLSSDKNIRAHFSSNINTNTLSKPVCYGTIQLPENGQPIVLMKERQTIGGYPVLGTVIQTDLFRLSQKRPGEHLRFSLLTVEQAQQQLSAFYQKFSSLV